MIPKSVQSRIIIPNDGQKQPHKTQGRQSRDTDKAQADTDNVEEQLDDFMRIRGDRRRSVYISRGEQS